jgi:hypothetical protein
VIRDALRDQPIVLPLLVIALVLTLAQIVGAFLGWA